MARSSHVHRPVSSFAFCPASRSAPLQRLSQLPAKNALLFKRKLRIHVATNRRLHLPFMCAPLASSDTLRILTYPTTPIEGQTTGTSGMRKKATLLLANPSFLPNWIQSLFNALGAPTELHGKTLILGGDGRFYNNVSAQTILRMAAANGIARVIVGRDALLTTPAVSNLIPASNAVGGIIMTASHNPAGPHGDWGIKYNTESGAPALEKLTAAIYEETKLITEYKLADFGSDIDLSTVGTTSFADGNFIVDVIDPVEHYRNMLKTIFDFEAITAFISRHDFSFVFDAMHASTGEYARRIFEDDLGAKGCVINGTSLEDFGGGHPDPNLTYAADLVKMLNPTINEKAPQFGAASDGDGDRNMILGRGTFVSPADSVAIIADHANEAIPYFKERPITGLARSMPTSSALDRVARAKNIPIFETPTGWKYFTNLMDAGKISICGEESFGTSSSHVREKDGLWAVVAWLSILAYKNRETDIGNLFSVEDILLDHWRKYGRTYNMRYDFESVSADAGDLVMINLRGMAAGAVPIPEEIERVEEFEYTDPVDGSTASQQGIQVIPKDGGRIVYRLSGTGSDGATIRIYFEKYEEPSPHMQNEDPQTVLAELAKLSLDLARIEEMADRSHPTVIT